MKVSPKDKLSSNSVRFQRLHLDFTVVITFKIHKVWQNVMIFVGAKADKFFILLSGEVSIFLAKSSDSIAEEEYSLPSR